MATTRDSTRKSPRWIWMFQTPIIIQMRIDQAIFICKPKHIIRMLLQDECLPMEILVGVQSNHFRGMEMRIRFKRLEVHSKKELLQLDCMTTKDLWMELQESTFIHKPRVNSTCKWTTHSITLRATLKWVTWLRNLNLFRRATSPRDPFQPQT